jgi:hypothetical protein
MVIVTVKMMSNWGNGAITRVKMKLLFGLNGMIVEKICGTKG